MKAYRPFLIIVILLLLDQSLKFWVKTHFSIGDELSLIGDRAKLYFVENNGMAFGLTFGGVVGKLILTNFRIIALIFIGWYLLRLIKLKVNSGLLISISLIFAGACGNILDSVFYGVLFSESTRHSVATFLPASGGYAPLLQGNVVDMLYFPIFEGDIPNWKIFGDYGGREFIFFRPVFNLADASITSGVILVLLFQKKFFKKRSFSETLKATEYQ